ncbi:MAG: DHA2 family efflux MFS transporter permease subunit [Methanotrichaceae archaeon]|nr:DHA2 family efflux MFS transporter permease subunit [Methanotrichaceae archaeon]
MADAQYQRAGAQGDVGHLNIIILTIVLASFMGALDSTIVNISLPSISRYFDVTTAMTSWILTVYLLVLSCLIVAFGRLGDLLGYKRVFLSGYVFFVVGSLSCGLSPSIELLIASRAVQAVGAAMLISLSPAMITAYLPENIRGRGLGYVITFTSLGIAAGPVLGGFLTEYLSWRSIFFINIPFGALAFVLGARFLPEKRSSERGSFDILGAVLVLIALFGLIFGLNMGNHMGWRSFEVIASLLAALAFGSAFLIYERRIEQPLVDLSLFKNASFLSANAAGLVVSMLMAGAFFIFPFYLELIEGFSVDRSGLILVMPSLAMVVFGPLAGILSDKMSNRTICLFASVLYLVSFLLLFDLEIRSSMGFILLALTAMGASLGIFFPPNTHLIMQQSPSQYTGMASSIIQMIRYMGQAVGIALFETVGMMSLHVPGGASGAIHEMVSPMELMHAYHAVFLLGVLLCPLVIVFTIKARDRLLASGEDAILV